MFGLVVVIVLVVSLIGGGATPTTGFDVSYPQCSGSDPANPLFAIVGVNGGLANNANPCLGTELGWAEGAPGQKQPPQPGLSLYIDTGNPGGHHVGDWPRSGTAPAYGACHGQLTNACSYLYGVERAAHSYRLVASHDAHAARTAPWWLDVELMATWANTYQLNIAVLQGFVAGLHMAGATGPVGLYSTRAQWKDITGLNAESTPTAFNSRLPDWIAGTVATHAQAQRNCADGGFSGAAPSLAQYRIGARDGDLRCASAGS